MKVHAQMILDENQSDYEHRSHAAAMVKDSTGAQMLIGLAATNKLPVKISEYVGPYLISHNDVSIRVQAAKYFKQNEVSQAYDVARIAGTSGNVDNGKKIFQTKCANCHALRGQGNKIAPDLSSASAKFNDSELLEAIIDPSKSIVFGYEPWLVTKKDNESIFGFLISDNTQQMVIRDLAGMDHLVRKEQITSAKKQDKSLMPSAVQNGLSEQQIADLLKYLKH
jgi:putative heme-binding domain-containing protein